MQECGEPKTVDSPNQLDVNVARFDVELSFVGLQPWRKVQRQLRDNPP